MSAAAPREAGSSERLSTFLDTIDIPEFQRELLRQRWLDQIGWMSKQAKRARRRYLWVRLPVVVGGVMIPALITILLSAGAAPQIDWLFGIPTWWVRAFTFFLSLLVASLAAADEVLRYAERWRHYRATAERLKTLGYQYLMLNGAFRRYPSHAEAFSAFTERVEDVLNEDVEGYLSAVASEGGEKRHDVYA